ncbi:hypothetical protein BH11PLA1_BH11PLA1_09580 [soil metagenome]
MPPRDPTRDETKDLSPEELADAAATASSPKPSSFISNHAFGSPALATAQARARLGTLPLGVVLMTLAGVLLAAGLILRFTARETERRESWFASIVYRGASLDVVDRSVGGLLGGDVLGETSMTLIRAAPDGGNWFSGPRVRDEIQYQFTLTGGNAALEKIPAAARAVLADQDAMRKLIGAAVTRKFPDLHMADMIYAGVPMRTRPVGMAAWGAVLACSALVLDLCASVLVVAPIIRQRRRAAAITRGECPRCGLPLANLRGRTCPKCGEDVAPEEFNRLRTVWREKGVGR